MEPTTANVITNDVKNKMQICLCLKFSKAL